jgi:hypothetical protein
MNLWCNYKFVKIYPLILLRKREIQRAICEMLEQYTQALGAEYSVSFNKQDIFSSHG